MQKVISYQLTEIELKHLKEDEAVVRKGIGTFVAVGNALARIKSEQTYLKTHGTFRDYLQQRWGITSKEASRQILSAGVVKQLKVAKCEPLPKSESVARELLKAPEPQRVKVWQAAVAKANGNKITAAMVAEHLPKQPKTKPKRVTFGVVKSQVAKLSNDDKAKLLELLGEQVKVA